MLVKDDSIKSMLNGVDKFAVTSKDYILNNVTACLVNSNNPILKSNVVSRKFLDFYIVYRVLVKVPDDDSNVLSYLVQKSLLDLNGITENELFAVVHANTNYEVSGLFETILGYLDYNEPLPHSDNEAPLFVVTNPSKCYGASVLITDYLFNVREKLSYDLAIIPCSVHEIIIFPWIENNMDIKSFVEMIHTVNSTELSPEDILSDNLYKFDATGLHVAVL